MAENVQQSSAQVSGGNVMHDWEKSKENVLPQKGGRKPEDIRRALQAAGGQAAEVETRRATEEQ